MLTDVLGTPQNQLRFRVLGLNVLIKRIPFVETKKKTKQNKRKKTLLGLPQGQKKKPGKDGNNPVSPCLTPAF